MKIFLIVLALLLTVIFQTTLVSFIAFKGIGPNLVLIFALILVIAKKFEKVWWWILGLGLFLDLLIGLPLGLASLSLISAAALIDQLHRSIFSEIKFWVWTVLIILGSLTYSLLLFGLGQVFQVETVWSLRYLLIGTIYNLLISWIFYVGFKKIFR